MNSLLSSITPRTIISDSATISQLSRGIGVANVKAALDLALIDLANSLNLKYNITDNQISALVSELYETYRNDSIEDLLLCFDKAKKGQYGTIYGLDSATIGQWMVKHLEVKAIERENYHQQLGKEVKINKSYDEWLKEQPQWFQDLSREEQRKIIDQMKKKWYEEGKQYLERQNAIRKAARRQKVLGMGFSFTPDQEADYKKFREEFINDYWNKQQSNDSTKTQDEKPSRGGDGQASNSNGPKARHK